MKYYTVLTYICIFVSMALFPLGCSDKGRVLKNSTGKSYTSSKRHKATMRPYNVLGKRYFPRHVNIGQTMYGVSSWYGPDFHGKYTSNGEIYNMHARTAAHKTWPMDTLVEVKNLENGKSTVVRINDRGPFVSGRIIDCSYKAGKELGLDKLGIAKVKIKVLGFLGMNSSTVNSNSENSHFSLQIASFEKKEGALSIKRRLDNKYLGYTPRIERTIGRNDIIRYRVLLTGFHSEQEAIAFRHKNNLIGTIIVRR